ncbi:MAG TPA: MFS transporter [Candidatus Hydrogenedentes bacterium]|nr:MFS transporter [Candidatus Hydrogenedentota bacterium]
MTDGDAQQRRGLSGRLPLVGDLRRLEYAPRLFLVFVAINVVSWQNIIGPVMVLLARHIRMPEFFVGMLLSFLPFTSLLILVTVHLIRRMGPKRVMLMAWFWRNVICCGIFLLPLAMRYEGPPVAWALMLAAIFGFSLMRALGAGGWLPWLHEIVPSDSRATYFSAETALTQLINVGIMLAQAALLYRFGPGILQFLFIYAVGISMGFFSLLMLRRIPGGAAYPAVSDQPHSHSYAAAFRDRLFRGYMLAAALGISATVWFSSTAVMFLRDAVGAHDSITMAVSAASAAAILLTIGRWGKVADRVGSGRAMARTLAAHSMLAVVIPLEMGFGMSGLASAAVVVVAASVFNAAFNVAANRGMLNRVPDENRVGYTAAWTVATSLALGVTPLLSGGLINLLGRPGYAVCFVLSALFGVAAVMLCRPFITPDRRETPRDADDALEVPPLPQPTAEGSA